MNDILESQAGEPLQVALAAINQNDISSALESLLLAAECAPEDEEIVNLVANCYYTLGEFDRARACWERAIEINPSNHTALQQLEANNNPSFQFWLKRYRDAVATVENRSYDKGCAMLEELIVEHDGFVSLYQLLGLCYLAGSDTRAACQVWSRGLMLDISNPVLLKYLNMPQVSIPVTNAEEICVKLAPSWFKSAKLGWLLTAFMGLLLLVQVGLAYYNEANQIGNNVLPPRVLQSQLSPDNNREAGAQPRLTFTSRAHGHPEDSMAGAEYELEQEESYYKQGYGAYLQGDWKTACSNLGVVVSMHSGNYLNREALYYLAQCHYYEDDYIQAEEYFKQYLKTFPGTNYYDDSLYYLGCTYINNGDQTSAKKVFTQLKTVAPQSGYLGTTLYHSVMETE